MGMSISSSRASTAMLSQPINAQVNTASAANLASLAQSTKPAAIQPPQLNTEGMIGTLLNMIA